jgi:zinc transport system permease protein
MDSFFWFAIAGGIGVALIAGPLGSFVVWRRMAYFGDTLSHSGLLGVALGILLNINPLLGLITTTITLAALLFFLERQNLLPTDTLLGILSHTALSIGLLTIGFMDNVRIDLNALLFGDLLSIQPADLWQIYGVVAFGMAALVYSWRDLLMITLSPELAKAEGINVTRVHLIFLLVMAVTIAMAMKVVGILLITSLLIIPAAAARQLAKSPEHMAILASFLGAIAVIGGLGLSWWWDAASGPAIVLAAAILFLGSLVFSKRSQ